MFHYLIACITKVNSNCSYLVQIPSSVVQAPISAIAVDMSTREHVEKLSLRKWCSTIVLVAICSLTVSLLTRYCAPLGVSSQAVKSVHVHAAPGAKKQHLAKDAADWIPPVTSIHLLIPSSCPAITVVTAPRLSRVSEQNVYNRPPPSSSFLG